MFVNIFSILGMGKKEFINSLSQNDDVNRTSIFIDSALSLSLSLSLSRNIILKCLRCHLVKSFTTFRTGTIRRQAEMEFASSTVDIQTSIKSFKRSSLKAFQRTLRHLIKHHKDVLKFMRSFFKV